MSRPGDQQGQTATPRCMTQAAAGQGLDGEMGGHPNLGGPSPAVSLARSSDFDGQEPDGIIASLSGCTAQLLAPAGPPGRLRTAGRACPDTQPPAASGRWGRPPPHGHPAGEAEYLGRAHLTLRRREAGKCWCCRRPRRVGGAAVSTLPLLPPQAHVGESQPLRALMHFRMPPAPVPAKRPARTSVVGSVTCGKAMPGLSFVTSAAGAALENIPRKPRVDMVPFCCCCWTDGLDYWSEMQQRAADMKQKQVGAPSKENKASNSGAMCAPCWQLLVAPSDLAVQLNSRLPRASL